MTINIRGITFDDFWRNSGRWINRLRFKTDWRNWMDGAITYGEYKDRCFYVVNAVREQNGDPKYSWDKFDNAWQYRTLCHDDYKYVYEELMNVIFGWW